MSLKKTVKTLEPAKASNRSIKSEEKKRMEKLKKRADNKSYLTEYSPDILIEALNIESAFTLANQCKQNNVTVRQVSSKGYSFAYGYEYTPSPDFEGLAICLKSKSDGEIHRGRVYYYHYRTYQVYFNVDVPLKTDEKYTVTYETSRYLIDLCIDAIRSFQQLGLQKYFTTFDDQVNVVKKRNIKAAKKWYNPKIAGDLVQQQTVNMILNESAYPFPFVVTGGPGTGKTSVIIETVVQIINNKSRAKILITSQSNSACDEVAIRLLNFLPSVKVFRYYSKQYCHDFDERQENYSRDGYFAKLCKNSTIKALNPSCTEVEYLNPNRQSLAAFKIIVATMTASVSLIKNGIPNDHFDFIFVDECGAAIEPECLIPIVSLGMGDKQVNANIILVGDDKSLGPILNSPLAKGLGLEQSLIERIMRLKFYDPDNDKSKGRIARFTNNYRSHPEIFKYSNETFYDKSMDSMVSAQDYKLAMKWKQLPNPDFPIIFHSVKAESMGNHDGLSWNNADEVDLVLAYVENLLKFGLPECKTIKQVQIGVASPYRAQVKLLRDRLRKFPLIDVGTTEFFQGREKPIMIISAAKSRNLAKTQDFLDNPRRLNVLLTRAKSLMIIIGNIEKLKLIASWERFIEHCIKNGVARRGPLSDEVDDDGQVLMERFSLLRIEDDAASNTSSDERVERSDSEEEASDGNANGPLPRGVSWNEAM